MSKVICIAGESGSGKTTSMRNLDPETTMYIDCDKKGLSWKGWRNQYKHIRVVVVDTINGLMIADEMRRCKEKGYDKWQDLAQSIYDLIDYALTMRDDVTIIFVAHTQTDHDDNGYMFTRIKTSGRKLDKITLESKFSTVLLSKCVDGKFLFETQANFSTAKTPMGAFEEKKIDNDIVQVMKALEEY